MGRVYSLHQENIPSKVLPTEVWAYQRTVWSLALRGCPDPHHTPCVVFPGEQGSGHSSAWSSLQRGLVWSEGRRCTSDIVMGSLFVWLWSNLDSFQVLSFPLLTQTADSLGFIFQPLWVSHPHWKQAATTTLYSVIKCLSFFSSNIFSLTLRRHPTW